MPLSPDIQAVLDRRLATEPASGTAAGDLTTDTARLLELVGFNAERVGRRAENAIVTALATGFDRDMLAAMMQAYARGLGRIVAAEADAVRKLLKARAPEERAEALERVLATNVPGAHELFQALHVVMLREALADAPRG